MMIGPLYGDNPMIARLISAELVIKKFKNQTASNHYNGIIINAIDAQPESLMLASEWLGAKEIERCERLFRGQPIKANYSLIYGVFSLDFAL